MSHNFKTIILLRNGIAHELVATGPRCAGLCWLRATAGLCQIIVLYDLFYYSIYRQSPDYEKGYYFPKGNISVKKYLF